MTEVRENTIKVFMKNEWDNMAYKKANTQVIEEHRNVLLDMLPELTWKEGPPEGYSIDSNGLVRRDNFESF